MTVMSSTQKALLYANIPTELYEYTVVKYMRNRFPTSPITYPALTVTFLTEGIKKHWNTGAPIETVWNETTHRYDSYYGGQDAATISLTLWSLDEDELRILADSMCRQLRLRGLDLDWVTDQIKVTNIKGVQWLDPYADEFVQEHTWRAVIDFEVEYLWKELEIAPAIRSYEYLFSVGPSEDLISINALYSTQSASYMMDIMMLGFRSEYTIDLYVVKTENVSYSMDVEFA